MVRGQFPHSEAKTEGVALGLVVKSIYNIQETCD